MRIEISSKNQVQRTGRVNRIHCLQILSILRTPFSAILLIDCPVLSENSAEPTDHKGDGRRVTCDGFDGMLILADDDAWP